MRSKIIWQTVITIVLLQSWMPVPQAQEAIIDPSQLAPHSILDDFSLEMPDVVAKILREKDMVFQSFELPRGERVVFQERVNCHPSGCLVVVVSVEEDRMFDPIVFVAGEEEWHNDNLSPSSDGFSDICVSGQYAFVC